MSNLQETEVLLRIILEVAESIVAPCGAVGQMGSCLEALPVVSTPFCLNERSEL